LTDLRESGSKTKRLPAKTPKASSRKEVSGFAQVVNQTLISDHDSEDSENSQDEMEMRDHHVFNI